MCASPKRQRSKLIKLQNVKKFHKPRITKIQREIIYMVYKTLDFISSPKMHSPKIKYKDIMK
uniref:Uncharacterized protein n=1 Tax=Arundo donax TaxID=35708 RepID=A0A0A9AHS1_ARUDO